MISKEEVQHIAKLAKIQLSDEELARYQGDLSEILDYFEALKNVDTSSVQPMTHSVVHENVAAEDRSVKESPDLVSRLLEQASGLKDGFLKVKSILTRS